MATIELQGVEKAFGQVKILHGIDLAIEAGEFVVFVGPSGCGKSTLLRLIAGLDEPTGGAIRIGGRDVTRVKAADRGLAMVFQSYALYPHMSVRQNLAFGLENAKLPRAEIATLIGEAAEMLQIGHLLDRRPGQLSGGQRQRVAIGRAIVRRPVAFLLDEPLSNLDAELRGSTRAEIAALHRRLGTTMIYVTHDQVEAMTLADRIVVLRSGRIEQVGAPLDLYNRPANRFVAGFIGAPHMNFFEGTVTEDRRAVALPGEGRLALAGALPLPAGTRLSLGVRPQHLRRVAASDGLAGRAVLVEALGAETILHAETAFGRLLAVLPGQHGLHEGEPVGLDFEPANLHLFGPDGLRAEPVTA